MAVETLPESREAAPATGQPPRHHYNPHHKDAVTTIPPRPDTARRNARKPPTAYASVFFPQGSRALYWLTFRCPVCGTHVFARCRQIDEIAKPRRATCGHKVATVAARLYGGPEAS